MRQILSKIFGGLQIYVGALFFGVPWITVLVMSLVCTFYLVVAEGEPNLHFGAIGITVALSGLAYTAYPSLEEKDPNRKVLIESAEMLFHATVCFCIALIMKFVVIKVFIDHAKISWFMGFIIFTFCTTVWGLFVLGITETVYALKKLEKVLRKPIQS